ncbi:MAG: UxaA family hydrolase [Clostridiales bacterium]|nr:UxaA family hydrolase [Clostridiales bacterium]
MLALKVNEKDNVATVFSNGAEKAAAVTVKDEKGKEKEIVIFEDIPYGHKLAIRDIAKGELIIKYGEEIGIAVADIKKGDYVHVHNLESMRGRGDWEGKK